MHTSVFGNLISHLLLLNCKICKFRLWKFEIFYCTVVSTCICDQKLIETHFYVLPILRGFFIFRYIDVGKQKLDLNKIDRKYQDAVKRRKEELSKIGDGVTLEAQSLFNRIINV